MLKSKKTFYKFCRSAAAMLLAACMLLPTMYIPAAAATLALSTSFLNSMVTGSQNSIPSVQANQNGPTQMELSWPLVNNAGHTVTDGAFWLRYVINDNKYVEIKLTRELDRARFEYNVYGDSTYSTAITPSSVYEVYDGGRSSYVSPTTHANRRSLAGTGTYYVDDGVGTPNFSIRMNYGFSFRYDGVTVHFLWDTNDILRVVTDGIVSGRLYEFKLYQTDSAAIVPGGAAFEAKAINGINVATLTAEPLAMGNSTEVTRNDVLDWDSSTASNVWHVQPAQAPNKIRLSFEMPVKLNTATGTYTAQLTTTDVANLGAEIYFEGVRDRSAHQIRLYNILSGMTFTENHGCVESASYAGGRVTLLVKDLPAGEIFNNARINLNASTADVNMRQTQIADYTLYTFLEYEIVYQAGLFHLIVKKPYVGKGYYMLTVDSAGVVTTPTPAVIVYSDGNERIVISLNRGADDVSNQYAIHFSPIEPFQNNQYDPNAIHSQAMVYKTSADKAELGVPGDFTVVDSNLSAKTPDDTNIDLPNLRDLGMELRWNVGDLDEIKSIMTTKGASSITITYNLSRTLTPSVKPTADENVFAQLKMTITEPTPGNYRAAYVMTSAAYNSQPDIDVVPLVLGETGLDNFLGNNGKAMLRAKVKLTTEARSALSPSYDYRFWYPNIYFLNIAPVEVQYDSGTPEAMTGMESLFDTMTLDDASALELPPPQDFRLANPVLAAGVSSLDVAWMTSGSQIKEFADSMYPAEERLLFNNIYISQSEAELKKIFAKDEDKRADGLGTWEYDASDVIPGVAFDELNLSLLEDGGSPAKTILDILREGKVAVLKNIPIDPADLDEMLVDGTPKLMMFKLSGLDKNTTYYAAIDATMLLDTNTPPATDTAKIYPHYSKLTSIVAETTQTEAIPPKPEEMSPAAPVLGKEDIGLSDATVFWDKIADPAADPGNTTEYEIIRTKDVPIPKEYLDTKIAFADFFNTKVTAASKVGLKTLTGASPSFGILEWSGSAFGTSPAAVSKYELKPGDPTLRVQDKTLTPNTLYYYYVRTVRTTASGQVSYSTWSVISVTSTPVAPPINLEMVRYGVTYNAKREAVIAFDAPIPGIAGLGTDFAIQASLKRDMDEWGAPFTLTSAQLISSVVSPDDLTYVRLTYRLTGLASGTGYGVRVRIQDLKQNDASIYSNIAEFRTDFDQADYDDQKNNDDWLSYLQELLAESVKLEYWDASRTKVFVAVYRPTMWNTVMNRTKDGGIVLAETTEASAEYYIPASSLTAANVAAKGFVIRHGNTETVLSPKMINTNDNEAVLRAAQRIKDKNAADYFLRVSVTWTVASKDRNGVALPVNNATPVSDEVTVALSLVTVKQDIKAWDGSMLLYMNETLAGTAMGTRLEQYIKDWKARGYTNEQMVVEAQKVLGDVKVSTLSARAASELARIRDTEIVVTKLSAPILIKLTDTTLPANAVVEGYQRLQGSVWAKKDLIRSGGLWTISATAAGSYIFTRTTISLPGLSSMPGGDSLQALIIQYGLDDYLGKGSNFNLNATMSMYNVAGVMARLAGAPRTANPVEWLRGKGYTAINNRAGAGATNQEAIYALMAMYEQRTGVKVSTIRIRNYGLTANMLLDSRYLASVQAAYELGFCTDKAMKPKNAPTVREVLQMLSAMQKKIKF